jgi:hypothetical protein
MLRLCASVVSGIVLLSVALPLGAWGEKGHFMINQLAIDASASRLPAFMNSNRSRLIYNAYEPDRWREDVKSPLNAAQAPDHFIDSEYWGPLATLEPDRYKFMEKVAAKKVNLSTIGYLPYSMIENYGRLVNAFRQYRSAKTTDDQRTAEANAVYYAGILGHYVGDGSQPMHTSIHFNGWAQGLPNPKRYTTDRMFHSRYETAYVNRAIQIQSVRPKVRAPQRLKDVFGAIKQYLNAGFSELEPMYDMEKSGEFNPELPRPRGSEFIAAQLARAASMLSDMWYTAWLESAEPPQAQ